ncbi:MAG: discoidin domain-containing protein [Desulfomonilaceae bacterium]|nr:discoidin domain-containing protein [Desulfomonilaceae bacterium]
MTEKHEQAPKPVAATNSDARPADGNRTEPGKPVKTKRSAGRRLIRFFFMCLYIGFLAAVVLAALAAIEYYAKLQVKQSPLGRAYEDRDLDLARRSTQKVAPQYGYEPTPGFAAVRNTRLGNAYEYINEQSFKDFDDVPLEKPEDEYRVFVTGGSVVFGRGPVPPADEICDYYEVTYRWTIPHIMEQLMNADPDIRKKIKGKTIRVINAGVAGYVYQNNLMRYLAKLRLYSPDLIVALDGANEVHTVARPLKDWNYFTEGPYFEVITEVMDMSPNGLMNYLTLWLKRNTYFFSWLAMKKGEGPGILQENRGFAAHPQDPTPEMLEYRERNIDQVADVAAIFHKVLETDGVPHVFALQPMFRNSKKKRMPIEQQIENVTGMEKIGFYNARETYDLLVERIKERNKEIGFEVVDLTTIYDDVNEWVFTDWCHLTNGANYLMAKALVNEVKTRIFDLPLKRSDTIQEPFDSYFLDYSKSATVLIDGRASNEGQRILKGYPDTDVLEIRSAGKGGAEWVVLDLGEVKPISRLRIVWADEESVPKSWRLESSQDGKEWISRLTVCDTVADRFDQWPGFEYYAPEDFEARYVRYGPVGDEGGATRLRQLSLFR